ncbi:MAG TPA: efflux RND transporter permease subunit [Candidatus Binatia bacterium]|nr:efflux RND transporter permease subunit [Candidatus Binatia bacterium]
MSIIRFCVQNPVTVWVGVILAVLFGVIALSRLPMQMIPTVDRPEITVETEYRGAGPLEVEREITRRQEEKLNSVEGLQEMTSTSIEGKSTIVLKFDWGVNKDIARLDVSEKLGLVADVPLDAERPQIRAVNSDEESPIAWIIVEADRPLNEVWEEVEDVVAPRLERVPGVGAVWRFGGQKREVHVVLDQRALAARGLTIGEIRDAVLRENRTTKAGQISEGKLRTVVRTVGEFTDLRPLEDIVVRRGGDGQGVTYLRDVARVVFGHQDRDFAVRHNGRPAIGMGVLRRSGANTIEVMDGIKAEVAHLNDHVYQGRGIRLIQAYDETEYIGESVALVTSNILWGGALAVVVLLLFLRSVRSVLVIAVAIPAAVVTTFVFLGVLGRTLNIISLAGLAFATGMVVDSAVVVLENIVRHREMGKDRMRAALDGAREVWGALLASTLTTVAVFVPVLFVQQEAGQLFRDIALAVSLAVLISLVVAVTVVPMLSARLVTAGPRRRLPRLQAALDAVGSGFQRGVISLLRWLFRGVPRRVAAAGLIVAAAVGAGWALAPPMDYLPQGNRNLFFALVRTPPGYSTEQKEEILKILETRFSEMPEIARYFSVVRVDTPLMGLLARPEHSSLPEMRRILAGLRMRAQGVPGAQAVFVTQSPLFRRRGAFFGGTNLEVNVRGNDLETIRAVAEQMENAFQDFPGANFVNSSFEWGSPELQVVIDRQRAAALGLTAQEIGFLVETAVGGTHAGAFREGGREIDIKLVSIEREGRRTQHVAATVFYTRAGVPLRLSEIAEVQSAAGPTKVQHIDTDRAITLTVNIRDDVPLETALEMAEREIVGPARQGLPLGYTIDVSGQARDLDEAWNALRWSYVLALAVIYLLMCSLFESWALPLYIMFTVPLAAAGGVLAVRLAHAFEPTTRMDTVTMLGFIILAGIVVNNAILIVHQALNNRRAGMEPRPALLASVESRLRPIFITTSTSIFGMLPLVVATGSGSELYRGLGAAVLGGLLMSSLFTVVLVPTLFSLGLDAARLAGRLRAGRARAEEPGPGALAPPVRGGSDELPAGGLGAPRPVEPSAPTS